MRETHHSQAGASARAAVRFTHPTNDQIRGAVAAVVIQDTAAVDENIVDYLRAVYGVN